MHVNFLKLFVERAGINRLEVIIEEDEVGENKLLVQGKCEGFN